MSLGFGEDNFAVHWEYTNENSTEYNNSFNKNLLHFSCKILFNYKYALT